MTTKPILIDDIIKRLQDLKDKHGNLEVRHYDRMYPIEPRSDTYPIFTAVPSDRRRSSGSSDKMIVAVV